MNKRIVSRAIATIFTSAVSSFIIISAQANENIKNDSLSLKEIIERTITTHPTVKVAEEAIKNAEIRVNLARTGLYPEVEFNANYSNLGPVTTLNIPDIGSIQLFPGNNYSAAINYHQVLYDFGRTRQNIEYENGNKAIGEQTLEQTKQKLSLLAVNNYYTLLFLQSAVKIKEEQLTALIEHLDHINKMRATGSATEYQVLSTKVRISSVESQKVDLQAAIRNQQALLNTLTGNDQSILPVVKNETEALMEVLPSDSLLSYALEHRDEILLNEKRITLAEMKYDITKLQMKPVLGLTVSGGAKNGYQPYLNDLRANYVLGVGFRVPIFDGMKSKYNLAEAQSAITSLSFETDIIKRSVSNDLVDAETYMISSERKVLQYSLQLEQALKAYSLALTSFNAGVITNLDLLDSNTSVSESRLLYLKARIDYAESIYRFRAALGERIYQGLI